MEYTGEREWNRIEAGEMIFLKTIVNKTRLNRIRNEDWKKLD